MADRPLRPATDRRLGGLLNRQLANQTQAHPYPAETFDAEAPHLILAPISRCYVRDRGRLPTRYSPVRQCVLLHP